MDSTSNITPVVSDPDPDKRTVDTTDAPSNETFLNPKNVVFETTHFTVSVVNAADSVPASGPVATASRADPSAPQAAAEYEDDGSEGDIIDNLIAMGWYPRGRPDRPSRPAPPPKPKPPTTNNDPHPPPFVR